ncbi:mechanosensitive ion channel domain-containing protein [Flagellimonas nanhaiensis]|uniref:Mechanosensitive ion channel family protein n=1 Tax=Flagellimonas nanhaiensis TaxID=2292706 RepID=A0A371JNY1_9FLAO|nr:mechanosensitive ion channel family protein [Allomuricauda nanhaiensis]RDY58925.1 mechanosensitive ion channel family protein [Allomuricauda nanhaiensis]
MTHLKNEILLTMVLTIVVILIILLIKRAVKRFTLLRKIEINRRKVILSLCYLLVYILAGSALALIWGMEIKQVALVISSVLAVLGIGFFAQWSILSNLTASVILFLSHPVRIGDRIRILDADFDFTGEVKDITGFYFFMKTDKGEYISLPNSLVIQKGIEILEKLPLEDEEN